MGNRRDRNCSSNCFSIETMETLYYAYSGLTRILQLTFVLFFTTIDTVKLNLQNIMQKCGKPRKVWANF